jgi:hypothetical protein
MDPVRSTSASPDREPPPRWQPSLASQLLGGDPDAWRAVVCSPPESSLVEIDELHETVHPALFLLLEGRVTVVFANNAGELHEIPLEPGTPVLISTPHAAYCPDGPHLGVALIVERAPSHHHQPGAPT